MVIDMRKSIQGKSLVKGFKHELSQSESQGEMLRRRTERVRNLAWKRRPTAQESYVSRSLEEQGIPFKPQVIMRTRNLVFMVDFLIDFRFWGVFSPVVLECSLTTQKGAHGVCGLRQKAMHLDYKFQLIKKQYGFLCVALLEMNEKEADPVRLGLELQEVFSHCDLLLTDSFNLVPDLKEFLPTINSDTIS